jgi:hypothetical protein
MHAPYLSLGSPESTLTNVFVSHSNLKDGVQLLEGIGAISKSDSKKAAGRSGNYQDAVTAPVSREHDDAGIANEEEETKATVVGVSPSINKVLSALNSVTTNRISSQTCSIFSTAS